MPQLNQPPYISIYHAAPDRLLDYIIKLSDIVVKTKALKGSNSESLKFYEDLLEAMRFAYNYMVDVAWVIEESRFIKQENLFLKKWSSEMMVRLDLYEGIREAKLDGTIQEKDQAVDRAIAFYQEHP